MKPLAETALDLNRPNSKYKDSCDSWVLRRGRSEITSLRIHNGQVVQSDSCEKNGFFASTRIKEKVGWHFSPSVSPGKENEALEKAVGNARGEKHESVAQVIDRSGFAEKGAIADSILSGIEALLNSRYECRADYSHRITDEIVTNDEGGRSRFYDSHGLILIRQTAFTSNGTVSVNSQLAKLGNEFWYPEELSKISSSLISRLEDIKDRDEAPAGFYPVILDSETGAILAHEIFGHGLEADYVLNNCSPFSGKKFEKVTRPGITVLDDGQTQWGYVRSGTDQEGTKTEQTTLICDGYLHNYIHSRDTANKFKTEPTGNGRAGCISKPPLPRTGNLQILPGDMTLSEVSKGIRFGIFAERALGEAFYLPERGMYWIEAESGYLIEDGKLTRPVSSFAVTGTVSELLHDLITVGQDSPGSLPGFCLKQNQFVPVDVRCPPLYIGKAAISPLR